MGKLRNIIFVKVTLEGSSSGSRTFYILQTLSLRSGEPEESRLYVT